MTRKQKYTLVILWILAATLFCCSVYLTFYDRGYTEVCFIDVEQGDCGFIQTDKLSAVLIDGGDRGKGEYTLIPFLRSKSVGHLDAVFVSHMHSDHYSGIKELMENDFPIDKIYISKQAENNKNYEGFKKLADERNIPVYDLTDGNEVVIDNVKFSVIQSDKEYKNENDTSLILRVDCGENSILFTGDATSTAEEDILENPKIDTDILKVPHHGSAGSSSDEFIDANTPELSVISVGEDNKYNHPSEKVLQKMENRGIPVVRTDMDGTVTIIMTDDDIKSIDLSRKRVVSR